MESAPVDRPAPGIAVVRPTGDVDAYTSGRLRAALHEAVGGSARLVVVDLTDVTFIDSSGLGALVGAHRRMLEAGGVLRVVRPPQTVGRAFELTGLDEVLELYDDRESALARP